MADGFYQKDFYARLKHYSEVWYGDRKHPNYNRRVQDIFKLVENEPSWFLRYHVYHSMAANLWINPSSLSEETVVSAVKMAMNEKSLLLATLQYRQLGVFFKRFWNKEYCTQGVRKAFEEALVVELERFDYAHRLGAIKARGIRIVVTPIRSILAAFDRAGIQPPPSDTPPSSSPNRAERRRAKAQRRKGRRDPNP